MRTAWLQLPATLDQARLPMPPDTADFLQVAQLANLVTSLFWGTNDFYVPPEHRLAAAAGTGTAYLTAREPVGAEGLQAADRIIGFATLRVAEGPDGAGPAEIHVAVHPDFRRRGVGSTLLREAEAEARRGGCTQARARTDNALLDPAAVGSGPVFTSGTSLETGLTPVVPAAGHDAGPGAVRSGSPDAAFAAAHGYELVETGWTAVLDLGRAAGAALRAESGSTVLEEYDYDLVEGDAGPVTPGRTGWLTAAHRRSDGLRVGRVEVESQPELPQVAYQGVVSVQPDHRGRGLALLLRAVAVSRLLERHPGAERLYAWSTGEDPELDQAGRELGFVPAATRPGWRKQL